MPDSLAESKETGVGKGGFRCRCACGVQPSGSLLDITNDVRRYPAVIDATLSSCSLVLGPLRCQRGQQYQIERGSSGSTSSANCCKYWLRVKATDKSGRLGIAILVKSRMRRRGRKLRGNLNLKLKTICTCKLSVDTARNYR